MKSICIKLSGQKTTKYLLDYLNNIRIDDVYFTCKKFKIYNNIIVHFKGKNTNLFLLKISKILSSFIIDSFEENIIKGLIKSEYFYFNELEQNQILNIVLEDLYNKEESIYLPEKRNTIIYHKLFKYFKSHHSVVLRGFVNFRIREYFDTLLEQIDKSVNKYIVEKEYIEFISILKLYVNSEKSLCNEIHIIYQNSKPILLDKNMNIINIEETMKNRKYLSDITFSNNDYALNTLLNLVPKKIIIHLIDKKIDEFINTIKLIFEDRVVFCTNCTKYTDCSICRTYKKSHAIYI